MNHNHSHKVDKGSGGKNIKLAFILNLFFTVFEIFGGFFTNSLAILSDAVHDFGDSFSLGLAWYFSRISGKKATSEFSYGFKRFSLLAALINGVVLLGGSVFILSKAIPRIITPEHSNAQGMFIFALIGIIVNGFAAWRLKGGKTMNERIVTWHLMEDVLGWAAVLIASIVMLVRDIHILDPILSILITVYILWNVIKNLKKTLMLFLQGVPESASLEDVERRILDIDAIKGVHDTHIWSLDGEHHILTTHIIVDNKLSKQDIHVVKCEAKKMLEALGIQHATIETETEGDSCPLNL
jgi:cobalt-zinc-cadmium efflux system protein